MTHRSRHTGQQGETLAQTWLSSQGFRIDACNWRAGRLGEIDIIAMHPEQRLLVFVEVKARRSTGQGNPLESVDARKQAKLRQLAEIYCSQHPCPDDVQIRFDVFGIVYGPAGQAIQVVHIPNAFDGLG